MLGGPGRRLGIVIGIAWLALSGGAGAATLGEEITELLRSHPQIKAARNSIGAAEKDRDRAFAAYLPTVSAFGLYGYEGTDSPGLRATRDGRSLSTPSEKATVTVTENLFDGFRTTSTNSSARLRKKVAEIALESTTQRLLFEGAKAYLEVLRRTRLLGMAIDNERIIQTQLKLEDERVRQGSGIAVDVLQAKARLQIAKERRVAFEGRLRTAIARYAQVFDSQPEIGKMTLPAAAIDRLPATLDEAEATAIARHPAAADAARAIDIAKERKRESKSSYYPRLDLVTRFNYEQDEDGIIGTRRDASVKLEANWDLFSGFSTRAGAAAAAYRYLVSVDNRNLVNRRLVEDVRLAWEDLATARQRTELLDNAVNIAVEVHAARLRLREVGRETVLNVLDAENEVFNARIDAADADFDRRVAIYRVLLAVGDLTPDVFR